MTAMAPVPSASTAGEPLSEYRSRAVGARGAHKPHVFSSHRLSTCSARRHFHRPQETWYERKAHARVEQCAPRAAAQRASLLRLRAVPPLAAAWRLLTSICAAVSHAAPRPPHCLRSSLRTSSGGRRGCSGRSRGAGRPRGTAGGYGAGGGGLAPTFLFPDLWRPSPRTGSRVAG